MERPLPVHQTTGQLSIREAVAARGDRRPRGGGRDMAQPIRASPSRSYATTRKNGAGELMEKP